MTDGVQDETFRREVALKDALHVRPATMMAQEAGKYRSRIVVTFDGNQADARSALSLLTLGAEPGARILIEASGPDAREAVEQLSKLVERGFRGDP